MTYCGYVALVGRPNVGKSTLLNKLLGEKVSITSKKAQTTQQAVLGIKSSESHQLVFVDTPGIHQDYQTSVLNRYMNRAAIASLMDADVIVFMVDGKWTEHDAHVLKHIIQTKRPCVCVINKVDQLKNKHELLPFIEQIQQHHEFAAIIPISAKTGEQLDSLESALQQYIPESVFLFDTDKQHINPLPQQIAETIREKIYRVTGEEIPYSTAVQIERIEDKGNFTEIHATIYVERKGQKRILIGEGGAKMKEIGILARRDLEAQQGRKINLKLWVKLKENWRDDDRFLQSMGFEG